MIGTSSALSPENVLKKDTVTISMRPISMSSAIPITTSPAEKHLARAPLQLRLAVGRGNDCKHALQIFCSTIWQTRARSLRSWDGERMTKHECRMTKAQITNSCFGKSCCFRALSFRLDSSFVIGHSLSMLDARYWIRKIQHLVSSIHYPVHACAIKSHSTRRRNRSAHFSSHHHHS